jgi:hypothetical protein
MHFKCELGMNLRAMSCDSKLSVQYHNYFGLLRDKTNVLIDTNSRLRHKCMNQKLRKHILIGLTTKAYVRYKLSNATHNNTYYKQH